MNILEAAEIVKDLANCISSQKGITVQEAYHEAIEELNKMECKKELLDNETR